MSARAPMQQPGSGPRGLRDRTAVLISRLLERAGFLSTPIGVATYILAYEAYKHWTDADLVGYIQSHLTPGDIAVDVGASVGFHALRMARLVGPTGRVLAFEPSGWAVEILRDRVRRTGLAHVEISPTAVGDRPGLTTLYSGQFPSDARIYAHEHAGAATTVAVETLDDRFPQPGDVPRLVKIDVQGAEVQVLRGMRRLLESTTPPLVVFEFWPAGLRTAGADPAEIFDIAGGSGLRVVQVAAHGAVVDASPATLLSACGERGYCDAALVP